MSESRQISETRICLISQAHLSANPRLLKEARALSQAGYKVSIICGKYSRWGSEADERLFQPSWKVRQVAFGPSEAGKPTYVRQNLVSRAAKLLFKYGVRPKVVEVAALGPVALDLKAAALQCEPADLYIAHYPSALPAAAAAAHRFGAKFAFDAEDFHLGDLPALPHNDLAKLNVGTIENRFLPHAVFVTASSPLIADAYEENYRIQRPTVILNAFPKSKAPAIATQRGSVSPAPSLYWVSQTIGSGRGLETAIKAIAISKSQPHFYMRGNINDPYRDQLVALALDLGISDHVHFLAPLHPDALEEACAEFDLGYAGETGFSDNNSLALSNKIFSFITSGLPIVVSDTAAQAAFLPSLGKAAKLFSIGNEHSLSTAIDHFLVDPVELTAGREHSWHLGQNLLSWETQEQSFLELVRSQISSPSVSAGV